MKLILVLLAFTSTILVKAQTTSDIWINEFHYDGLTTYGQSDQNEFVELVIKSSITVDAVEFAKYSLVLYTVGSLDNSILTPGRGLPYNTASPLYTLAETVYPLNGFQSCPSGAAGFTMLSQSMAILQDLPAAMAIVYNNTTIVQLLSYEKSFKIAPSPSGGAAAGLTTTLIVTATLEPADETALSTTSHAVSLTGTGNTYSQFAWDDNLSRTATPCAVNNGQTLLSGVLPLNLISFDAIKQGTKAKLSWVTSAELNLRNFEIERSVDGVSFVSIGRVNTMGGNFQQAYSFMDNATLKGKNYYRLKMIDTDDKFNYSKIRALNFDRISDFVITPNPAQSMITLQFNEVMNNATIRISNQQGQIVKQLKMTGSDKTEINVSELAAGVYVVEITSGTFRQVDNLVIRR